MLILGIETSCDETSASVLRIASGQMRFLSNAVFSQIKLHAKTSGVVPEVAAREHIKKIIPVIDRALKESHVSLTQIELIAVTAGPGLLTSLLVGVDTAKALSFALNIPIIAINHIEAHIFSPFIQATSFHPSGDHPQGDKFQVSSPVFPAISLVVSGGHTELFLVKNWLDYKKLGGTVDDAAGVFFDKTAKLLGLPYPCGPSLSKLAKRGKPNIVF
ncbi:MAG: tRNA (adenosine(37)-N6)-threonylcarbamoyltransferase complex transferase subunit TsaD, partial [bacterium]|nr:tRNA (adenosine(37)-N6)-threonylcarbamoyltransferase complex transferase subunit TsaD [bacterium]